MTQHATDGAPEGPGSPSLHLPLLVPAEAPVLHYHSQSVPLHLLKHLLASYAPIVPHSSQYAQSLLGCTPSAPAHA